MVCRSDTPFKVYNKDAVGFVYNRETGKFEQMEAGKIKIKYTGDRNHRRPAGSNVSHNNSFPTNIGYICARDVMVHYDVDYIVMPDDDPVVLYAVNVDHDPAQQIISVSSAEMRLNWFYQAPELTMLGEQTLFADISKKRLRLFKSDNGGNMTTLKQAEAKEFLENQTGGAKMLSDIFPALRIDLCSSGLVALNSLHKHPGLLDRGPFPPILIYSLREIDGSLPFFQFDFSKYKPFHECLNLTKEQYQALLKDIPARKTELPDYRSLFKNYVILFLLKAYDPACFRQSVKEMLDTVLGAYYFQECVTRAVFHGIPIQDLVDYIQSQMEHRLSINNLMTKLRTWLRFPSYIVQKTLPDKLEDAIKTAKQGY